MTNLVHLTPLDPQYPSRLRGFEHAPASITVKGGSTEAAVVVAVVGSRKPLEAARVYAGKLAVALTKAGAVVVSGGALGIDGAAHTGAQEAGGRTWVVAPTGHERCFPPEHKGLFARIGRGPGVMIWPFAPSRPPQTSSFHARNRVLVALADAVVVVQAGPHSGALHAASWARKLRKPLWVVPVPPWIKGFDGSLRLLAEGAQSLTSTHAFLEWLGPAARGNRVADASQPGRPLAARQGEPGHFASNHEFKLLGAISTAPRHADAISASAGMSPQATTAALLTLALENVVVEGPPGFFRRREAHNR
jgi:DNA processing protein